ncbi:MAG TPA: DUF4870 domain-containing protein [Pseudolysinimonas sp.]|jgi:hypothetical protein
MSQPPPPPVTYAAPLPMNPADERLWATLVHVGGIIFHWLAPLILFLVLKDRGPFVRWHTRQALNFQLTLLIAYIAGAVLSLVFIGFFVVVAAFVLNIVFGILAAVAANRGEFSTYPVAIEFVR